VLLELGVALAQAGKWEDAERVWQEAERVSRTLSDTWPGQAQALRALVVTLAQVDKWEDAERVSHSISNASDRVQALQKLGEALAQVGKWEDAEHIWQEAERVSCTLSATWREQEQVLRELADTLVFYKKYELLLRLIQQQWLKAETRDEAIHLLPLAFSFVRRDPKIAVAFSDSFTWVNNFLRG
jgi:tetratricopeptide (TPR) repeat protein